MMMMVSRIMSSRIISMRESLRQKLEELGTPGDWSHITTQIGMFSYTGLSQEMCVFLKNEKHLYMLKSGRISMCGVCKDYYYGHILINTHILICLNINWQGIVNVHCCLLCISYMLYDLRSPPRMLTMLPMLSKKLC